MAGNDSTIGSRRAFRRGAGSATMFGYWISRRRAGEPTRAGSIGISRCLQNARIKPADLGALDRNGEALPLDDGDRSPFRPQALLCEDAQEPGGRSADPSSLDGGGRNPSVRGDRSVGRWSLYGLATRSAGTPSGTGGSTPLTMVNYMIALKDLYRQRAKLDDAPLVDPLPIETTYEAAGVTRENKGAIPFIPDAVAIDLLSKALTWVDVHADTIIAAETLRRKTRAASIAAGRGARSVRRCAACASRGGSRRSHGRRRWMAPMSLEPPRTVGGSLLRRHRRLRRHEGKRDPVDKIRAIDDARSGRRASSRPTLRRDCSRRWMILPVALNDGSRRRLSCAPSSSWSN